MEVPVLALDWNMVDEETVRGAGGLQTEVRLLVAKKNKAYHVCLLDHPTRRSAE